MIRAASFIFPLFPLPLFSVVCFVCVDDWHWPFQCGCHFLPGLRKRNGAAASHVLAYLFTAALGNWCIKIVSVGWVG